jgi:hypothetical protein
MFQEVLAALDRWVTASNLESAAEGLPSYPQCTIRLLGQMALWELNTPFTLAVTQDVDVYADYPYAVQKRFETLLAEKGKILDPHGDAIWMPRETVYREIYNGRYVHGLAAEADFVLLSKAKMAPEKNRALLLEALARGPSERFLQLAEAYDVDLEVFL